MHDSAKTLLTAIVAVAGAAVMGLVLADQSLPRERHTAVQPERVATEAGQQARPDSGPRS